MGSHLNDRPLKTSIPRDRRAIEALLPHAGAMCLISRIEAVDASLISCVADNHADPLHPLRHAGRLPITAGIEYGAQAVALHSILRAQSSDPGISPRPRAGYLAVLRDVRWYQDRLDQEPGTLQIDAHRLTELDAGLHYLFALRSNGRSLIEGELIIALDPR